MARKSAAAESIAPPPAPDRRLPPPPGLSIPERNLWDAVTTSKPADWFDADSAPVLLEYIRAATTCDRLAEVVERAFAGGDEDSIKLALDMRDKEARRCAAIATKLRLTQQSRYTPQAAATADRKASGPRPWQT